MKQIKKNDAIKRFLAGEIIYICKSDGHQSVKLHKSYSDVQSLKGRDGRKFQFCIGVI